MATIDFGKSEFVTSCVDPKTFLRDKPTVLFCGRSNAGKSTLINSLCRKKDLMKTSARPGKTRMINYAVVDGKFYIADSPGYGFESERNYFQKLMDGFFNEARKNLKGVVMAVDSRRGIMSSDQLMIDYATSFQVKILIVLTKCDKLNRTQIREAEEKVRKALPEAGVCICGFKMDAVMDSIRNEVGKLALSR